MLFDGPVIPCGAMVEYSPIFAKDQSGLHQFGAKSCQKISRLCITRGTMTMTMTHSEKSHIGQMRAWPYRQECRGHGPTKKNLSYR